MKTIIDITKIKTFDVLSDYELNKLYMYVRAEFGDNILVKEVQEKK